MTFFSNLPVSASYSNGNPINSKNIYELASQVVDSTGLVLNLYDRVMDRIIPWDNFTDTMQKLNQYRNSYSVESGALVGGITKLMMDAQDAYFESTQSIYEWADLASRLFKAYLRLFTRPSDDKAKVQRSILLTVLGQGEIKLESAKNNLLRSSRNFNDAAGKMVALNSRLNSEYNENNEYVKEQVARIRELHCIHILWFEIGCESTEFTEDQLCEKLENIQKFHDDLQKALDKARRDIEDVKIKLQEEVSVIGELKTAVEAAQAIAVVVTKDADLIEILKENVQGLITQCDKYQERHGKKIIKTNEI